MSARVLWRDAQGAEGSIELSQAEAFIGRAVDCAIRTDDAMVSRHHARLFFQSGQYFLEDLGSANGVYYQEQRVVRHALRHGDAVRCGSLWLRFVDDGAAPAQRPLMSTPSAGQAPPPGSGGPPPPVNRRPGATAPPPVGQTPAGMATAPAPGSAPTPRAPAASAPSAADAGEMRRLRRRIDQLQAELRMYRGGGDKAQKFEDLEQERDALTEERDALAEKLQAIEGRLERESGSAKVKRAGALLKQAADLVNDLNDVLSDLRINVMAAQGEFEQFASAIPRASFELIREALKTSAEDVDSARDMFRKLRDMAE